MATNAFDRPIKMTERYETLEDFSYKYGLFIDCDFDIPVRDMSLRAHIYVDDDGTFLALSVHAWDDEFCVISQDIHDLLEDDVLAPIYEKAREVYEERTKELKVKMQEREAELEARYDGGRKDD